MWALVISIILFEIIIYKSVVCFSLPPSIPLFSLYLSSSLKLSSPRIYQVHFINHKFFFYRIWYFILLNFLCWLSCFIMQTTKQSMTCFFFLILCTTLYDHDDDGHDKQENSREMKVSWQILNAESRVYSRIYRSLKHEYKQQNKTLIERENILRQVQPIPFMSVFVNIVLIFERYFKMG